jgi:glycosyltransferase involved in cell wall biosynthesis
MRIVHVTDHFTPVLGGIETHVAALAERQALRGDDVTVLTSTPMDADGRHSEDAGPVRVRRARNLLGGTAFDFRSFDVVHAHISVVAPFSSPVSAVAARRGVPTIVTVHSLWSGLGPIPAVAAGLARLRSAPVQWTAVSAVAADQLRSKLPRDTSVRILPNAVSVRPRTCTPEPHNNQPVRLVSTMRIARRKRPLQLLAMFESVRRAVDRPVELTIIGDGPLRARLEQRIARSGLRNIVTVTGRVEPEQVFEILRRSDVYVAPALLESFGLAALEARCVGLPVVGHAASGLTEFIADRVEGVLCRSDEEMVSRLRDLVLDNELRTRISDHNRTALSTMTWTNTMEAHDRTYALVRGAPSPSNARQLNAVMAR